MFGSEILDIVIGLIFIFLLLSLLCSAVKEAFEAWFKQRAANLEKGIRTLLHDKDGAGLAKMIYNHPLINGLFHGDYKPGKIKKNGLSSCCSNLPSYIPSRAFALALLNIVAPTASIPLSTSSQGSDTAGITQPHAANKGNSTAAAPDAALSGQDSLINAFKPIWNTIGRLGSTFFYTDEFLLPITVERLCKSINDDNYGASLKAPINTIDWLNELLKIPDFYEKLNAKKPRLLLTDDAKDLVEKTKEYRTKGFADLKNDEQNMITRLNRFLLEETYPQDAPKCVRVFNEKIRDVLMSLASTAGNDINKSVQNIEEWYNATMERVSGWYKRHSHGMLLMFAFIITIGMNVNTIDIANALFRDKALRDALIAEAVAASKEPKPPAGDVKKLTDQIQSIGLPIGWTQKKIDSFSRFKGKNSSGTAKDEKTKDTLKNNDSARSEDSHTENQLTTNSTQDNNGTESMVIHFTWTCVLSQFFGWCITAFAISLGAPFWFDLLGKFMKIRSTIKPGNRGSEKPAGGQ